MLSNSGNSRTKKPAPQLFQPKHQWSDIPELPHPTPPQIPMLEAFACLATHTKRGGVIQMRNMRSFATAKSRSAIAFRFYYRHSAVPQLWNLGGRGAPRPCRLVVEPRGRGAIWYVSFRNWTAFEADFRRAILQKRRVFLLFYTAPTANFGRFKLRDHVYQTRPPARDAERTS